ncbi:helix-turn-helix transcriptional regulator [Azospirillum sp. Vi22]|uniref:ArsR/SmtB family transcription factor n=1 Tax=Azospirillum baldaniorum TaxID=1064539 RepID=UPI00157A4F4A|nr:metalloregulator ArsR/SmtB family transcription factor [Azospirillum baldaniorum]NUB05496.1 helix-turn-helix transcriptional regulator [Azospirillum baldaniorum]
MSSTEPPVGSAVEPPLDPVELEERATEAEAFLRSIASRHRLMILCSLLDGEMAVGDLARRLGLSQSNLSQHLAKLRDEGLVATRRDGTSIHYRIGSDRVRPILLELYRQFCVGARCVADADPTP